MKQGVSVVNGSSTLVESSFFGPSFFAAWRSRGCECATGAAVAVLLGLFVVGCGTFVEQPTSLEEVKLLETKRPERYRIQAGDQLEIRFFHTPNLNLTLPVRPDGYISFDLVGDVQVSGKTTEEIRVELEAAFEAELRAPQVAVIVQSFARYRVHVGGDVFNSGVIQLIGPHTVLDAALQAGIRNSSRIWEVIVIRRRPEGGFAVIPVDLQAVLDGTDPSQNIDLQPYDAVFVPRSEIADVNVWVDQYMRQNIPINFGVTPL